MSQVFQDIEKKIITSLKDNPKQTPDTLEKSTQLSPDQIRRGIEWLKLKDLAIVNESKTSVISLGKNGIESFQKGLPERRLLDLLKDGPRKLSDLQKELLQATLISGTWYHGCLQNGYKKNLMSICIFS